MKRRHAFSLIEAVAYFSLGSMLMAVTIGLIHQIFTESQRVLDQCSIAVGSDRFLEQFRSDAHQATAIEMQDAGLLRLRVQPANEIIYQASSASIVRTHEVKGKSRHREELALPSQSRVYIDFDAATQTAGLSLHRILADEKEVMERSMQVRIGRVPVVLPVHVDSDERGESPGTTQERESTEATDQDSTGASEAKR